MIFVIPVFQHLYQQLHIQLPLPTQILILMSQAVRHHFWFIPVVFGVVYWGFKILKNRPGVKTSLDRMSLRVPVLGTLYQMILVSRYIRTFAMMSSAGVSVVEALQQARKVCHHTVMDEVGKKLEQEITSGGSLSVPLAQNPIFPPLLVQLSHAGEEPARYPRC